MVLKISKDFLRFFGFLLKYKGELIDKPQVNCNSKILREISLDTEIEFVIWLSQDTIDSLFIKLQPLLVATIFNYASCSAPTRQLQCAFDDSYQYWFVIYTATEQKGPETNGGWENSSVSHTQLFRPGVMPLPVRPTLPTIFRSIRLLHSKSNLKLAPIVANLFN